MTTIAVSTTSTTAFTVSADTSGSLVLQTGATPTTALTLDGSQNATLAGPLTVPSVTVPTGTLHGLVLGTAQASTSGTSIDFTGIPSWVKRITVMFNGVSTSGSSNLQLQIGSGSIDATGYVGGATQLNSAANTIVTSATGFILIGSNAAAYLYQGQIVVAYMGSNLWTTAGSLWNNVGANNLNSGSKLLSGTLDRVRITTVNGTDTFDAGSINIMYEG